jgi:hypothetical protein
LALVNVEVFDVITSFSLPACSNASGFFTKILFELSFYEAKADVIAIVKGRPSGEVRITMTAPVMIDLRIFLKYPWLKTSFNSYSASIMTNRI